MEKLLRVLGRWGLSVVRTMGRMIIFLAESLYLIFSPPFKFNLLLRQIRFFGTKSLVVILLTGAFTGMVLAIQLFYTLRKFGSDALLGPAVALSLIRELGPVLSALMVTGRAGSSLTAEIGIMRISEQIDVLTTMALNPLRYLSVPNIVAGIIVFPLLAAIYDVIGIYGGYVVGVKLLGLSSGTYFSQMENFLDMSDIRMGIYKSVSFGIIVSWVSCYKGYHTDETGYGAEGVSKATTEAVVMSSVLILVWDYFLGSVLL
ncbi:MAG: MlaE family lipid ABC transporter permease subunit [Nitrospirae bacterium]|nr:MlaE family lipid ABC transporter permease subunit [Nitrospirota bacterium]MCL5236403.1 MlaE family lipid ABC transporter permease subunit [Nitrospirota bacterium]